MALEIAALEHDMEELRLKADPNKQTSTGTASSRKDISKTKSRKMLGITTMFPEIFEVAVPCDPDAEVQLNIPRQISLPI